jgi:hypothetical protein
MCWAIIPGMDLTVAARQRGTRSRAVVLPVGATDQAVWRSRSSQRTQCHLSWSSFLEAWPIPLGVDGWPKESEWPRESEAVLDVTDR